MRSAPQIPATGQNGSSRHVSASFDIRSEGRLEQSSGLLIGWFGQVSGGVTAPEA